MSRTSKPIRVVIVEDSPTMRAILQNRFEREDDIVVVGAAANAAEGRQMIRELDPDVDPQIETGLGDATPGPDVVEDDVEEPPPAPELPAVRGAAGGAAASSGFRVVFSLGDTPTPAQSESLIANPPTTLQENP